jgi:23S rRNA pseudouridine2605 synthase
MQTSVGYIGADAYFGKTGGGGRRGGGGGGGGGGGRGRR